jgi:hypothetical protein
VNHGLKVVIEFCVRTTEFSDHLKFPLISRVDCADLKTRLMRMMSDGDVATISAPIYAKHLSNEFGHRGDEVLCSLDENFIYGSAVCLFTTGNPLLNQINTLIR